MWGQDEFAAHLRAGGCGVFPTDTVPGLGAKPEHSQQLYRLKGRDPAKPLVLLAGSLDQIRPYCTGWASAWEDVMARFWPGALTLVLPASALVPPHGQQAGSVGLRIPNHPTALALLLETGPLAATSVNLSGQPALTTPETIRYHFPDLPRLTGTYPPGTPSTVIRWQAPGQWELLRQGPVVWPFSL
ncbi:L-threonylcarbamoyladenylate synthase [Candidatus Cyanaurora vandensis]|uniref:L-threonylcarbamoyladenylate synthase n=1 Tax=Candidatus Cyanaurora vandensis TaxID=2714958 RepID=UPI00257C5963|nr:L-threonylcarbamoyladenylate synthase [Candidatus Cyanaurora vandensis]